MENINETKDRRKTRLVFPPQVARKLCKRGFVIVDLKPLKTDREKSVFIFENTPEFKKAFDEIITEMKFKEKTEKDEPEQLREY